MFVAAGKVMEEVVRKGQEANDVAVDGLDKGLSVGKEDYWMLADRLTRLLDWQRDMSTKLTEAIECVDTER